jgi:uncharacterized membrane protein YkvA (DUF1232 family)
VALALILAWVALLLTLLAARPNQNVVKESLRLLPDLVRLVTRLAKDGTLPRGVRIRLALLLAHLACPFDLVPDFVPILGYADDVIAVLLTLRSVIHIVGDDPLRKHWPGTPAGLDAIVKLTHASRRVPGRPRRLTGGGRLLDARADVAPALCCHLRSPHDSLRDVSRAHTDAHPSDENPGPNGTIVTLTLPLDPV